MNNIASKWMKNLHGLRKDERGAEATEVIFMLVLIVVGLYGVWHVFQDKIKNLINGTGSCLDGAADAAATC